MIAVRLPECEVEHGRIVLHHLHLRVSRLVVVADDRMARRDCAVRFRLLDEMRLVLAERTLRPSLPRLCLEAPDELLPLVVELLKGLVCREPDMVRVGLLKRLRPKRRV